MPYTDVDEVSIHYEVAGHPAASVLVLIAGGGAQLTTWEEDFCSLLVAEGLRVVRLDNRDVGLSQRFGGPDDVDGGYGLADMAADVVRVLDHLGVGAAHLVGHSMGGMIAQTVAIDHPGRVKSLGLLSTIPGQDPRYILHGERTELLTPPPRLTREESVEAFVRAWRPAPGAPYAWDEDAVRRSAGAAYDRAYSPDGFARQWSALLRAPERLERLGGVTAPTLVLHGRADGTLHWCAALDMAEAIEGAELRVLPDMGHLISRDVWPVIIDGIVRMTRRAGR